MPRTIPPLLSESSHTLRGEASVLDSALHFETLKCSFLEYPSMPNRCLRLHPSGLIDLRPKTPTPCGSWCVRTTTEFSNRFKMSRLSVARYGQHIWAMPFVHRYQAHPNGGGVIDGLRVGAIRMIKTLMEMGFFFNTMASSTFDSTSAAQMANDATALLSSLSRRPTRLATSQLLQVGHAALATLWPCQCVPCLPVRWRGYQAPALL